MDPHMEESDPNPLEGFGSKQSRAEDIETLLPPTIYCGFWSTPLCVRPTCHLFGITAAVGVAPNLHLGSCVSALKKGSEHISPQRRRSYVEDFFPTVYMVRVEQASRTKMTKIHQYDSD